MNATEKFEGKIRVRINALIYKNESLLLIKHRNIGPQNELWIPPGGGLEFGESIEDALKREVLEETGLSVKTYDYQFIYEFINPPLHAVEIFFRVKKYSGEIKLGRDPELGNDQIIEEVKFVTFHDIGVMEDEKKHGILRGNINKQQLQSLRGIISFN